MRTLFGAALLVAACAFGQGAQAGVATPFISENYYEQNGTATCPPGGNGSSGTSSATAGIVLCQVLFPTPPAGKKLALNGVSCQLRLGSQLRDVYIAVNLNGTIRRKQYLKPVFVVNDSDSTFANNYAVNEIVHDYVVTSPIRIVSDAIGTGGYMSMDCQISGTLLPA